MVKMCDPSASTIVRLSFHFFFVFLTPTILSISSARKYPMLEPENEGLIFKISEENLLLDV